MWYVRANTEIYSTSAVHTFTRVVLHQVRAAINEKNDEPIFLSVSFSCAVKMWNKVFWKKCSFLCFLEKRDFAFAFSSR